MKKWGWMVMFVLAAVGIAKSARADERSDIEGTVRSFLAAVDRQEPTKVAEHLHPAFRVVYTVRNAPETTVLDWPTFKKMIEDKKAGGKPRTVKVLGVEREDTMAIVRTRSEHPTLRFDSTATLVLDGGRWKMIEEAVVMTVKAK